MKPQNQNETVLDNVEESRRDFVKKVIVGATFSAPLLASFSMDGMLIGSAEANCAFAANMTMPANMTTYYCANQTTYDGSAYEFYAQLKKGGNTLGQAIFKLTHDNTALVSILKVKNRFHFACISWGGKSIVNLEQGRSVIEVSDLDSKFCPKPKNRPGNNGDRFNSFLNLMASGKPQVVVQTAQGIITGTIVPRL